jgi:hypothetical protein
MSVMCMTRHLYSFLRRVSVNCYRQALAARAGDNRDDEPEKHSVGEAYRQEGFGGPNKRVSPRTDLLRFPGGNLLRPAKGGII